MVDAIGFIVDKMGIIVGVAVGILVCIALVRMALKVRRGESTTITPVGVMKDLPDSVTGMNKHNDLAERSRERSAKKTQ